MITHRHDIFQKPERVVLLGARGFIGTEIHKQLEAAGIAVFAPLSSDLNLAETVSAAELASHLKRTDAVVMLAALTPEKGRDIATMMKNLTMMQNVCSAIGKAGCAHLTYFSSDAVYDISVSRVAEETPVSPQDLYGVMHYNREIMARTLVDVPLLVLRPTLVYGVNDTHNSYGPNRFRRSAQKEGKIMLFGGGEETRDYIHVSDVAKLTVRCLQQHSVGILNVATGFSTPLREIAVLVAKQFVNGIDIVTTTRINPITHRHYDVTGLIKAFPDFKCIGLEDGVTSVHRESERTLDG